MYFNGLRFFSLGSETLCPQKTKQAPTHTHLLTHQRHLVCAEIQHQNTCTDGLAFPSQQISVSEALSQEVTPGIY